jgi:hypothetical protein
VNLLVQGALSFHAAPGGRTRRVATITERRGKDAALPRKLIEGPLHGKTAANRRVSARGDPSGRRGHDLISGVRVTRRLTCERKEAFLRLDQLLRIHRPLSVGRSRWMAMWLQSCATGRTSRPDPASEVRRMK